MAPFHESSLYRSSFAERKIRLAKRGRKKYRIPTTITIHDQIAFPRFTATTSLFFFVRQYSL
jgi:hypothetical protein